jgi:hypothetical protein
VFKDFDMTDEESFEVAQYARVHFRQIKADDGPGRFDSWAIADQVVHPRFLHLDVGEIEEIVRLEGMAAGLMPLN